MAVGDWQGASAPAGQSTTVVGNVGDNFGWTEDYDPDIKTGTKPYAAPALSGRVVAIRKGSIDVQTPDGHVQTISSWNGRPVTEERPGLFGEVSTHIARGMPVRDELSQGPKGGVVTQYFDLQMAPPEDRPVTDKATNIMKDYSHKAQSSDAGDRQKFLDLQDKLVKGGFLDKDKFIKGLPDDATQKALHDALVQANRTGQTLDEVLDEAKAGAPAGSGKQKATRDIRLTSPADIQQSAINQAPGILGRGVDPTQVASLTAQYNALEAQQQNSEYDAQDANTGAGSSSMTFNQPNVNTFINQQLRASDPNAAQGMALGHYLSEFMALMSAGGTGTPNTFGGNNG